VPLYKTARMTHDTRFTIRHDGDFERSGRWILARRSLGLRSFGMNLVDIEPGGSIPEHDETPRNQEEVYVVLSGSAAAVVDGIEHPAPAGTYVRLDPEPLRSIANVGEGPVRLLIVSAPVGSGYEPMEWA
jgi:quercetin dioxygenase-like cupin family protein